MEEDIEPYKLDQDYWHPVEPAALSESAVKRISEALVGAKEPLIITGYSGRNHATVPALVKLADIVKGIRVLDTGGSDMCFPADHRAWLVRISRGFPLWLNWIANSCSWFRV
jgi:thiamine pyrophosphate-dependent acetolactate synthase large subunit-like protein